MEKLKPNTIFPYNISLAIAKASTFTFLLVANSDVKVESPKGNLIYS